MMPATTNPAPCIWYPGSGLDIQEFMIAPVGLTTFHEKVRAGAEVITALKKILKEKGYSVGVGDEGGFAPKLKSIEEAFELIMQAIQTSGYSHEEIKIGIDAAASSFYHEGTYQLKIGGEEKKLTNVEMVNWYTQLANTYPIYSIEDGLAEDDWEGFTLLTETLGKTIHIVGDDVTVTNSSRIQTAIEKKAINAVLIKLNQIGTFTETINAIELTKKQNWIPFISHRSGETIDTFIADLAVGLSCDCIKSGSLVRGERVAKYNRLLQIENLIR
jgi:enolase